MSLPERVVIAHADLDCFFVAVARLDDPSLIGRPVVVGGSPEGRSVVTSASYEARAFGIHAAMPMGRALRLCPGLVRASPGFGRYKEESDKVFAVLAEFTPELKPLSIDEAWLDLTGTERLLGSPAEVGRAIKQRVRAETGLIISVGIGPNRHVAKLASDRDKPDGLTIAPFAPQALRAWLAPLAVEALWGVGPVTGAKLREAGWETAGALADAAPDAVAQVFGAESAARLQALARGDAQDSREGRVHRHSISHETTFARDIEDRVALKRTLGQLADKVAARARKHGVSGRIVRLKVRYPDFTTITRARTRAEPTDAGRDLLQTGWSLFCEHVPDGARVRLIGLALGNVEPAGTAGARQRSLFAERSPVPAAARRRLGGANVSGRASGLSPHPQAPHIQPRAQRERGANADEPPAPPGEDAGDTQPPKYQSVGGQSTAPLERAMDDIRARLGNNAIQRARDIEPS